jgi:WhiB family redox-sensing transcriptional regulator
MKESSFHACPGRRERTWTDTAQALHVALAGRRVRDFARGQRLAQVTLPAARDRFGVTSRVQHPHDRVLMLRTEVGDLPCTTDDDDLWFATDPADVEQAKDLCRGCPIRRACLTGALQRAEPWGVWGGELFENGAVIPRRRPRGRPPKSAPEA